MDIGLVCDDCSSFSPMGAKECGHCGSALSLDLVTVAPGMLKQSIPAAAAPTVACPRCGIAVPADNRFCGGCGAPAAGRQRASSAPTPTATNGKKTLFFGAMQAARAKLVLIKGNGLDGVSFTLAGQEHWAGSSSDADLPFQEDPYMSPIHANFFYRDGALVVTDESSGNGIFTRIDGRRPIPFGSRFLVGEQVLEAEKTNAEVELHPTADGTYFFTSPRRATHFRVVQLLHGGGQGLAFRSDSAANSVSLGREGNDINFPDDPFISGHHAVVSYENNQLMLADLGSKNGTFLRIDKEATLKHGDYVFMGQQLLRVEIV